MDCISASLQRCHHGATIGIEGAFNVWTVTAQTRKAAIGVVICDIDVHVALYSAIAAVALK